VRSKGWEEEQGKGRGARGRVRSKGWEEEQGKGRGAR
jgi:hypothetical protein